MWVKMPTKSSGDQNFVRALAGEQAGAKILGFGSSH